MGGRLSEEDIERVVREAEEFAEEDKKVKERIDGRNGLESYLYNLKNTLDDDEKGLADKIPEADKEDYDEKRKEVEHIANPIMRNLYQGAGAGGGGFGGDDEDYDFGDDEL